MKKRRILIYDPYLDHLGGGERYILSIAQVFDEHNFDVVVVGKGQVSLESIRDHFGMNFQNLRIIPNVLRGNKIKKTIFTSDFDYLFYVTDGSYFFSLAKQNYSYAMVPQKNLYKKTLLNRSKWWNYQFVTHSKFVQNHVDDWTGKKSQLLYPYISYDFMSKEPAQKKKYILSVGRFFKHLHSKRQDILIESFKKLKQTDKVFTEFKLILAGGLKQEDKQYLDELKKMAGSDPNIVFVINEPFSKILSLYKESLLYWHASGFGVDAKKHPDQAEHLGIAPLEAMAAGCVTFCYDSAGPAETIRNGIDGFLYSSENELINKTIAVVKNPDILEVVRDEAIKTVSQNFSYEAYKKRVEKVFNLEHTR